MGIKQTLKLDEDEVKMAVEEYLGERGFDVSTNQIKIVVGNSDGRYGLNRPEFKYIECNIEKNE